METRAPTTIDHAAIIGEADAELLADYQRRYPTETSADGVVWWYTGEEPRACIHGMPFTTPCNRCERNAELYRRAGVES